MTTSGMKNVEVGASGGVRRWWRAGAAVFALIFVSAAVLRFVRIGAMEISPDEGHSFYTAASSVGVFEALRSDTNQPLYFLLLKGWMGVFGESIGAMRAMSAFFGVLTMGVVGLLVQLCGASRRTVMWAVLLAGFAPLQIYYAQEARGYTLAALLVALGMLTFVRALQSGRWGAWLAHSAAVMLGAYAHNIFIPVAGGYWIAAAFDAAAVAGFLGGWR